MPVSMDHRIYLFLNSLKNCWGLGKDDISFQDFTLDRLDDATKDGQHLKVLLAMAIHNYELFMVFCHGLIYVDVTVALCTSIREGVWNDIIWSVDYLIYEVTNTMIDIYGVLTTTASDKFLEFNPSIDIGTSTGSREYIHRQLSRVIPNRDNQMYFQTVIQQYNHHRAARSLNGTLGRPPTIGPQVPLRSLAFCRYHLQSELKCKRANGQLFSPCSHGGACKYPHIDVQQKTKLELSNIIRKGNLHPPILKMLLEAVAHSNLPP
jgi:hypothetical protein